MMIHLPKGLVDIDTSTKEGRMLLAALSIITSSEFPISRLNIGSHITVSDNLNEVVSLTNCIFNHIDLNTCRSYNNRCNKINDLLDE